MPGAVAIDPLARWRDRLTAIGRRRSDIAKKKSAKKKSIVVGARLRQRIIKFRNRRARVDARAVTALVRCRVLFSACQNLLDARRRGGRMTETVRGSAELMIASGQRQTFRDVCVTSAFPLIATKSRTSHHASDGPKAEVDRSATLFNPSRCENPFCLWRGEICEKCFGRVCGRSIAHERRSVARIVLNVRWQRTDQLEALWFE
jgi:hypothetical protein